LKYHLIAEKSGDAKHLNASNRSTSQSAGKAVSPPFEKVLTQTFDHTPAADLESAKPHHDQV